ncbi:Glycosyl hydrolases family 28 [Catalinimonas alkaloidigena]|uniref:Glycosyl hydrolases family 28 n=1 Tax=Catalinimonas alkaloidigena TaxID=1075417 RepID=A0A1G9SWB6_9BACT|nr:glycoside hydrolase family 28 protein [Catalinimonas alkaloidigena]SDM39731.1 Glycosyl hydrolases family 28 [Catalinimonas alkaloidigena]
MDLRTPPLFFLLLWFGLSQCTTKTASDQAAAPDSTVAFTQSLRPAWADSVGATAFPEGTAEFSVNDYGARADGTTLTTEAIQRAIDACAEQGGGLVTFRPGQYLTGSLFLKQGVHLRLDRGVTLLGSQNIADYPEIDTRVAGLEMRWPAALLNVLDQTHVAITGDGTVHAQGKPFWDYYWNLRREYEAKGLRWIVDYDAKRPRTLLVSNASDVTLRGLTLQQAGFWTVHVLYSDHVTVDGLVIRNNVDGHGPSTDGIDIDSSRWILVENCDIDCNDDNFCLKAGRDWDGLRVNRPTEYVVIRYCLSRKGGGLITFGSETSGGIRHVLAHDLQAKGTGIGLRFKSAMTRGGTVEDVHLQRITMDSVGTVLEATVNWNPSYSYSTLPEGYTYETLPPHWKAMLTPVEPAERGIPQFRDVFVSDVEASYADKALVAIGAEATRLENFHLWNLNIRAEEAGTIDYATGWTFRNVAIRTEEGDSLVVDHSEAMAW